MAGLQMGFPVFVGEAIPPFRDGLYSRGSAKFRNKGSYESNLELNGRPRVEINRFNFANVCSHRPVNTRASDAQKHAAGKKVLVESCFC